MKYHFENLYYRDDRKINDNHANGWGLHFYNCLPRGVRRSPTNNYGWSSISIISGDWKKAFFWAHCKEEFEDIFELIQIQIEDSRSGQVWVMCFSVVSYFSYISLMNA